MSEALTTGNTSLPKITPDSASSFLQAITGKLQEMESRLHNILAEKEDDFLQLGSNLMGFSTRSGEMSSEVSQLARITSGEEITGSLHDLQNFLGIISSHCRQITDEATLKDLSEIITNMQRLKELFQDFARVIKALRMLGISTRIESARLGEQGKAFTSLADDVDKLVARIEESSTEISKRSNQIIATTLTVQDGTQELFTSQHCLLDTVTSTLSDNIDDLAAILEHSDQISDELVSHSKNVGDSISTAVTSLQFHDIVRQQIEHVEECTRDSVDLLHDYQNRDVSEHSLDQILTFILQVAQVQISQLDNGRERFNKAVQEFKTRLEEIADIVDLFMNIVQRFNEAGHHEQGSVLDAIKASMGQVTQNVYHFLNGLQEQQKLIAPVAETVENMDVSARQVQDLGDEIELISLNASIKSACVGDQGRAMGVLAHEIQRLSMQTKEHTSQVLDVLASLAQTSNKLQTRSGQADKLQDLETTLNDQQSSLGRLVTIQSTMDRLFDAVSSQGESLREDIRDVARGIEFHETICANLREARHEFMRILDAVEHELVNPAKQLPPKFNALLQRYTMESERIIHQMALSKSRRRKALPETTEDDQAVMLFDDSDDSVELFDNADDGVELFGDDDNIELF